MKLQTQIPLKKKDEHLISYHSHLVLFGSCFSQHIGNKLLEHKFQTISNPFGILFHPKAIENLISKASSGFTYTEEDVFQLNEQFQCFDAHSKLNTIKAEGLVSTLNKSLINTKLVLTNASHIVITLGTAWVYKHKETNQIVANCHKVPQKAFQKELLSIATINDALENCINKIKAINPNAHFIFTLSPVRHIKDGFTENSLSKAHLLSSINQIVSKCDNTSYFPSYEIMMDELRDYRFYNEDMLHPNTSAINYIWSRFSDVWMNDETLQLKKEIEQITNGLKHKPFNSQSEAHQKFLQNLRDKQAVIASKLPFVKF